MSETAPWEDASRAYEETPMPDPESPWREAEFCVIDLETTGLEPQTDEIISFAALHVVGGRLRLDDACSRIVHPRRMPSEDTIRIHGLRKADLADAPPLAAVLGDLLEALAGRALVAHAAWVEKGFLTAALGEYGIKLRNPIVDTAALGAELSRRRQAPPESLGLTSLAKAFELPVHRPHEADGDALTTAQLFLAIATHLDLFGPQTVGSMSRMRIRRDPPLRRLLGRVRDLLRV